MLTGGSQGTPHQGWEPEAGRRLSRPIPGAVAWGCQLGPHMPAPPAQLPPQMAMSPGLRAWQAQPKATQLGRCQAVVFGSGSDCTPEAGPWAGQSLTQGHTNRKEEILPALGKAA